MKALAILYFMFYFQWVEAAPSKCEAPGGTGLYDGDNCICEKDWSGQTCERHISDPEVLLSNPTYDSIEAQWKDYNPVYGGDIEKYYLSYKNKHDGRGGSVLMPSTVLNYTMKSLLPSAMYKVTLSFLRNGFWKPGKEAFEMTLIKGNFYLDAIMEIYIDGKPPSVHLGIIFVPIPPLAVLVSIGGRKKGGKYGIIGSTSHGVVTDGTWKCTKTYHENFKTIAFDDSSWGVAQQVSADNSPTHTNGRNINSRAQWIWYNLLEGMSSSDCYCRRFIQVPGYLPANLHTSNIGTRTIKVWWENIVMFNGEDKNTRYNVSIVNTLNGTIQHTETQGSPVTFMDLTPFTNYTVRLLVLQITVAGYKPGLSWKDEVFTDEYHFQNLSLALATATSLTITWSSVPDEYISDVILVYKVNYTAKHENKTLIATAESHHSGIQLTDLSPETEYQITVSMQSNLTGFSSTSDTLYASTDIQGYLEPASSITSLFMDGNKILPNKYEVIGDDVLSINIPGNGNNFGFTASKHSLIQGLIGSLGSGIFTDMYWACLDYTLNDSVPTINVLTTETHFIVNSSMREASYWSIDGLDLVHKQAQWIQWMDYFNSTNQSVSDVYCMRAIRGPGPVENLSAVNVSSTSLLVIWDSPLGNISWKISSDQTPLPLYHVTYWSNDFLNDKNAWRNSTNRRNFTLTQLIPCTLYTFQVAAESSYGIGISKTITVRTVEADYIGYQRPTRQISTNGNGLASLAVDGSVETCSLTNIETSAWWAVELDRSYFVKTIDVNTPDMMLEARVGESIIDYNKPCSDNSGQHCKFFCKIYSNKIGKFVSIHSCSKYERAMTLCEVQITAVPIVRGHAPIITALNATSAHEINIQWLIASDTKTNSSDPIRGYNIFYTTSEIEKIRKYEKHLHVYNVTLDGLKYESNYSIQLSYYTGLGEGPRSNSLAVQTLKEKPCQRLPCLNQGKCLEYKNGSFHCHCAEQYHGSRCEIYRDPESVNFCTSPLVIIKDISRDILQPSQFLVSESLTLHGNVSIDCPLSRQSFFLWEIYLLLDDAGTHLDVPSLREENVYHLFVPRRALSLGRYMVILSVTITIQDTNVSSQDVAYMQLDLPPLRIRLTGGSRIQTEFGKNITLSASLSYDPATGYRDHTGMNFTWLCRNESEILRTTYIEDVPFVQPTSLGGGDSGCYGTGPGRLQSSGVSVTLNTAYMKVNKTYFVSIVVSKDHRLGQNVQIVEVLPLGNLMLRIRCQENCEEKMNPSSRMSFTSSCSETACDGEITFIWKLFKVNRIGEQRELQPVLDLDNLLITKPTASILVMRANSLQPDSVYIAVLTGQGLYTFGQCEYEIITNHRPVNGSCSVTPSQGVALNTLFKLICTNWTDHDTPLRYEFIQLSSDGLTRVIQSDMENSIITVLPLGDAHRNYTLNITAKVSDSLGSFILQYLQVQVNPPLQEGEKLKQEIDNLITGDDSVLNGLLQVGDVESTMNLASAVLSIIDAGPKEENEIKINLKFKSSIINLVTQVKLQSIQDIQRVSTIIAQATQVHDHDQISSNAMLKAMDSLASMVDILQVSTEDTDSDSLKHEADNLIVGLDNVLKASTSVAVNNNKSEDVKISKETTAQSLSGLEGLGKAVLSRRVVGEPPIELTTQTMTFVLKRLTPELAVKSTLYSRGTRISFPGELQQTVDMNKDDLLDIQMYSTESNPYPWDISSSQVNSLVVSLDLFNSASQRIKITNTSTPFDIRIPRNYQSTTQSLEIHSLSLEMVYHKIHVSELSPNFFLVLRTTNLTKISVFVKHLIKPSLSKYDLNFTLSDSMLCNFSSNSSLESDRVFCLWIGRSFINRRNGTYFIGLKSDGLKEGYYSLEVLSSTCLYWDSYEQQWTSKGCQVGPETTKSEVQCLCTHLTSFASQFLVLPNPIDFDKVLVEFSRLDETKNYTVIITVSTLLGLYLLGLVFAKRSDRADGRKIGRPSVLTASTATRETFIYRLKVSTGIWRNRGTTSQVYIVLHGQYKTSEPFHLRSSSCIPFARGSINTFILIVPEYLGEITSVSVWHDNSGSSPSWFLNQVTVYDMQTEKEFHFVTYRWLAIDRDDGLTHCKLPLSGDSELRSLSYVFRRRVDDDFGNEHLWISVLTKTPQHYFTRVQRLTCCMSMLFTVILANAMFYQLDSSGSETDRYVLRYGFLKVGWRQFLVGLESALVVLPINLLALMIFQHAKPKYLFTQQTSSFRYKQSTDDLCADSHGGGFAQIGTDKGRLVRVPSKFRFLGWIVLFLTISASVAFIVLYSMQWGKELSDQWITSALLSFLFDAFVIEPIKIVALAVGLSFLFRKAPESCDIKTILDTSPKTVVTNHEYLEEFLWESEDDLPVVYIEPSVEEKEYALEYRDKVAKMHDIIQRAVFFIGFLILLFIFSYGARDDFGQVQQLNSFIRQKLDSFTEVDTLDSFWDWCKSELITELFELDESILVGTMRLRQLRVTNESCTVPAMMTSIVPYCIGEFSLSNEFTRWENSPGWLPTNSINNTLQDFRWNYRGLESMEILPFWGDLGMYFFGGFYADLGHNNHTAYPVIQYLEQNNWLDRFTRFVLLEFNYFTGNTELFTSIKCSLERSSTGTILEGVRVESLRLYFLGGEISSMLFVCQITLPVFILYQAFVVFKRMLVGKKVFFKDYWNMIDLIDVCAIVSVAIVNIFKLVSVNTAVTNLHTDRSHFVSLSLNIQWNLIEISLLSLVVFLNTLKLLALFKFNYYIAVLFSSLREASIDLAMHGFVVFALIGIFGYAGCLIFGHESEKFKDPLTAFKTMFTILIGKLESFEEYQSISPTLGPVFVFLYTLIMTIVFANLFISTVILYYQLVQDFEDLQSKDYEMIGFMIQRFSEMCGFAGEVKTDSSVYTYHQSSHSLSQTSSRLSLLKTYKKAKKQKVGVKTSETIEELYARLQKLDERIKETYLSDFNTDLHFMCLLASRRQGGVKLVPEYINFCAADQNMFPLQHYQDTLSPMQIVEFLELDDLGEYEATMDSGNSNDYIPLYFFDKSSSHSQDRQAVDLNYLRDTSSAYRYLYNNSSLNQTSSDCSDGVHTPFHLVHSTEDASESSGESAKLNPYRKTSEDSRAFISCKNSCSRYEVSSSESSSHSSVASSRLSNQYAMASVSQCLKPYLSSSDESFSPGEKRSSVGHSLSEHTSAHRSSGEHSSSSGDKRSHLSTDSSNEKQSSSSSDRLDSKKQNNPRVSVDNLARLVEKLYDSDSDSN